MNKKSWQFWTEKKTSLWMDNFSCILHILRKITTMNTSWLFGTNLFTSLLLRTVWCGLHFIISKIGWFWKCFHFHFFRYVICKVAGFTPMTIPVVNTCHLYYLPSLFGEPPPPQFASRKTKFISVDSACNQVVINGSLQAITLETKQLQI